MKISNIHASDLVLVFSFVQEDFPGSCSLLTAPIAPASWLSGAI